MPKTGSILPIRGLNTETPAEYIKDQATPNSQNMTTERSILATRRGNKVMGGAMNSEDVMAGRSFSKSGVEYVVRIGPTKVEKYNTGTSAWDDITGTDLTATDTDPIDTAVPLISASPTLIFTNFIDDIRKYTGTGDTADLSGPPPKAKFCEEYKSYLVLAYTNDGNTHTQRVQWSDTGDPETWSGGNTGNNDLTEDGKDITGMKKYGGALTIHKENCIYIGYLIPNANIFKFDRKNTGIGTESNNTIQNLPTGQQAFLSKMGIVLFNGTSTKLIPGKLNKDIQDGLNYDNIDKCWSRIVPEKNEYWVGVPIGSETTADTIFKYNYKNGTCFKDTRSGIICAFGYSGAEFETWDSDSETWDSDTTRWDDTVGEKLFTIPILGDKDGYCYGIDSTLHDDNGTAVDAFWESKDFQLDEIGRLARWLKLEFWAKGSGVTIDYSTDKGQTWNNAQSFSLSNTYPNDESPDVYYLDAVSSQIRFRFRNNSSKGFFFLKQFITWHRIREHRLGVV